jgi:ketosteroid isomerase-like protein
MSSNLDLVRSIFAAWERGDFSHAEWAHPEIEYGFPDGPSPVGRTGLAGMAEGEREFLSAWENFRIAAEEYREIDEERVLSTTSAGAAKQVGWTSRKSGGREERACSTSMTGRSPSSSVTSTATAPSPTSASIRRQAQHRRRAEPASPRYPQLWPGHDNRSIRPGLAGPGSARLDNGPMGSANLDLVRSIYAAWERGDFTSAAWAHPEIEWVVADGPDPGSWTGLAGDGRRRPRLPKHLGGVPC